MIYRVIVIIEAPLQAGCKLTGMGEGVRWRGGSWGWAPATWWRSLTVTRCLDQRSSYTSGPVSTWMGDRLRAGG